MKIMHLDSDGNGDRVSLLAPDPDRVDELGTVTNETVAVGIACRWFAVRDGECPCGGVTRVLNRKMKREAFGREKPPFDGFVKHASKCPSMFRATRVWLDQNQKALS